MLPILKNKIKLLIEIIFFSSFILIFIFFLVNINILPFDNKIPLVFLFGVSIIILTLFYIILNLNRDSFGKKYELKWMSEDVLKLGSSLLLIISLLIPAITSRESVILWGEIPFINFIRAIIAIINISFLPGACIYSLSFSKNKLPKILKIDSIIIKLTIYPILSWSFIGIIVLIFDQIGFVSNLIFIFLIISIFLLFLLDIKIKTYRDKYRILKIRKIILRKSTFLLLILASGIALFSIGISLGRLYLIGQDDWVVVSPTIYIGKKNLNPFNRTDYFYDATPF